MKQTQAVLAAIGVFIEENHITIFNIKGYFGFAYLTVEYFDTVKKYKFAWDMDTEKVVCTLESASQK